MSPDERGRGNGDGQHHSSFGIEGEHAGRSDGGQELEMSCAEFVDARQHDQCHTDAPRYCGPRGVGPQGHGGVSARVAATVLERVVQHHVKRSRHEARGQRDQRVTSAVRERRDDQGKRHRPSGSCICLRDSGDWFAEASGDDEHRGGGSEQPGTQCTVIGHQPHARASHGEGTCSDQCREGARVRALQRRGESRRKHRGGSRPSEDAGLAHSILCIPSWNTALSNATSYSCSCSKWNVTVSPSSV